MDKKEQVLHKIGMVVETLEEVKRMKNHSGFNECMDNCKSVLKEAMEVVEDESYQMLHMVGGKRVLKCGTMYVRNISYINADVERWEFSYTKNINESVDIPMNVIEKIVECYPIFEVKNIRMVEM